MPKRSYKREMVANAIGGEDVLSELLAAAANDTSVNRDDMAARLSELSGITVNYRDIYNWSKKMGIEWKARTRGAWDRLINNFGSEEAMVEFIRPLALDPDISTLDFESIMRDERGVDITYSNIARRLHKALGTNWIRHRGGGRGWRYPGGTKDLVAALFSAAFDASGYSYEELARELGVSKELVRLWIEGSVMPRKEAIEAVRKRCVEHALELQSAADAVIDAAKLLKAKSKVHYTKRRVEHDGKQD